MKINSVLITTFFLCVSCKETTSDRNELAKLYVAYFEQNIKNADAVSGNETFKRDILKYYNAMASPSYFKINFKCEKYFRRFMKCDIFLVSKQCRHCTPYIVGIDDRLNIYRLSGFGENDAFVQSEDLRKSFNDSAFYGNQVPVLNNTNELDVFVEDYVKLIVIGAYPDDIAVDSINVTHKKDGVLGSCVIRYAASINQSEYIQERWSFAIGGESKSIVFTKIKEELIRQK